MSAIARCVNLALALVLLNAGAAKLANISSFTQTVAELLHISRGRLAATLALFVVSAELTTAVTIVLFPAERAVAVLIVGLALVFSIAGAVGLRRVDRINCNCFGAARGSHLGWWQVLMFPFWISAAVVYRATESASSFENRVAQLQLIAAAIVVLKVAQLVPRVWQSRATRRRIEEAIPIVRRRGVAA